MRLVLWVIDFYKVVVTSSLLIPVIIGFIVLVAKSIVKHKCRRYTAEDTVVEINITDPEVIAKIDNLEEQLEVVNNQIVQQRELLSILEEQHNLTFDCIKLNKLMGDILKVKSNILKLTDKSDKLGFTINKIGKDYYYSKICNNR